MVIEHSPQGELQGNGHMERVMRSVHDGDRWSAQVFPKAMKARVIEKSGESRLSGSDEHDGSHTPGNVANGWSRIFGPCQCSRVCMALRG